MTPDDDAPTEALLDGRYQLQECIGEGGMARVHRGFDLALGRSVAIKVMRDGTENASALERARGEMGLLASLSHPSLVTLFDAKIAPGRVSYLVMELVDGPTLAGVLREGPLAPRDAARLAVELADALHVVHAAGIVHRDVKPSNVLLSPPTLPGRPRRARLADFGIAYLVDSSRLTTPGVVVGTMAYLAPEQVKGEPPAPPADIYALGLLVIEALTGQRPFGAIGGVESLVTRVTSSPEVPSSLGDEWGGLLRRMTALDPAQRPTASEVATAAAALEHVENRPTAATAVAPVVTPVPVPAARTTEFAPPASRAARRRSRRPLHRHGLAIAGGATAAAAVIVLGAWLFGGPGAAVPSPAETVAVDTVPSEAPATESGLDVETVESGTSEPSTVVPVDGVVVDPGQSETDTATGGNGQAPPPAPSDTSPVQSPAVPPGGSNGADRAAEVAADNAHRAEERDAAKAAAEAQRAAEKTAKQETKPGKNP